MTELQIFQQTSNEPYTRHTYEVVLKNGKRVKFQYFDEAREYWFYHSELPDYLDFIEVKDKKPKKGFA